MDLFFLLMQLRLYNTDQISAFVFPQYFWLAVTASPSTAWPVYASSSNPLLRKSTTFLWPTPAITCWTCPATRPKRPCGTGSRKPWSSTRASVWSERDLQRWLSVCWHCTLNLWRNGNECCSRIYFTTDKHTLSLIWVNLLFSYFYRQTLTCLFGWILRCAQFFLFVCFLVIKIYIF